MIAVTSTRADLVDAQARLSSRAAPLAPIAPADALFAGRYRVRRQRGEGGMARVYEAVDLHTGRPVAVKMLRDELVRNQEARFRFQCEAGVTSRVTHPNVVSVIDVGHTEDRRPFMVMEWLDGRDLGELVAQEGSLSPARALRIGVQACRGLEAIHRAGIIHRDLKPENLLICAGQDGADRVKILDLGIAKVSMATDPLARMIDALDLGRIVGTPNYMAPEQVCDPGNVNPQSDVFALGLVLREALTGLRPHEGKSGGTIIDEILSRPLAPAGDDGPGLTEPLASVVQLAQAPDPRARYGSAQAFGEALSEALSRLRADGKHRK